MNDEKKTLLTNELLRASFTKNQSLPVMPEVGQQLLELKNKEDIELDELIVLIESEPVISAKIVAYASSPFYSYQGKLESVQEAVYHVLGLDMSMNVALSMCVGNQFKGPIQGPVGAKSVWNHSVYCAVLSQAIASKIKNQAELKTGTAYLYGLLHNIGFLALGHMFSDELNTFNEVLIKHDNISLDILEQSILGVSHAKAGKLLMESWSMPKEFSIAVEHHHDSEYLGPHQIYNHISYMANALLKSVNIGDAPNIDLPKHLLEEYNLSESDLMDKLNIVTQWKNNIDHLVQQLVA